MGDLPELALIHAPGVAARFPSHPHAIALLPDGMTIAEMEGAPRVAAAFLVDRDCGFDTLNGSALSGYLRERVPVRIHAQRARDLRPFLRRADTFRARGYGIEVLS